MESKAAFTPQPGQKTKFEAAIRFGANPQANKQGLWPAFWLLGESVRYDKPDHKPWPLCGELDIMETVSGAPTAYGTAHCGPGGGAFGGPCAEPLGRQGSVALPDDGWHTWTLQIDRTAGTAAGGWQAEHVRWLIDGRVYHQMSGADVGVEGIWATLAHSPMFIILDVAVGGTW